MQSFSKRLWHINCENGQKVGTFGHLAVENPFLVSAHELFTLAVDWSLHWGQMMYYLSSPAARGETMGLYVRVTVWGYFIPAFFSTSVPCWTAVSVSASLHQSRLADKSAEPGNHHSPKKWAEGPQTESRRELRRLVHLYCCASGISWHVTASKCLHLNLVPDISSFVVRSGWKHQPSAWNQSTLG